MDFTQRFAQAVAQNEPHHFTRVAQPGGGVMATSIFTSAVPGDPDRELLISGLAFDQAPDLLEKRKSALSPVPS